MFLFSWWEIKPSREKNVCQPKAKEMEEWIKTGSRTYPRCSVHGQQKWRTKASNFRATRIMFKESKEKRKAKKKTASNRSYRKMSKFDIKYFGMKWRWKKKNTRKKESIVLQWFLQRRKTYFSTSWLNWIMPSKNMLHGVFCLCG